MPHKNVEDIFIDHREIKPDEGFLQLGEAPERVRKRVIISSDFK
jgi:hypothetical protein